MGMCIGGPAVIQYNHAIDKWLTCLTELAVEILEEMNVAMKEASEQFDFETGSSIPRLYKCHKIVIKTRKSDRIYRRKSKYHRAGSFK